MVLIYGMFFIINLFVSGFENGDWYGFAKWGFMIGLMIFIVICLSAFVVGELIRLLNKHVRKNKENKRL